jgi:hypothetical protein
MQRAVVHEVPVQNSSHFPEHEEACWRWRRDPDDLWHFVDEEGEPQRWLHPVIGLWERRRPQFSPTALSTFVSTLHCRGLDCIAQGKLQLRLLDSEDYSAGYMYTPDLGTRLFHRPARVHCSFKNATSHRSNSGFLLRLSVNTNFPVATREWVDTRFADKLASSVSYSLFSTLLNTTTITCQIMMALKILKLCLINVPMTRMPRRRLFKHI